MFSGRNQSSGRKSLADKRKRESTGTGKRPRSRPSPEPDNKRYSPFLLDDTQDVIWEENPELEGLSCTQTDTTEGLPAVADKENVQVPVAKLQKKRKWKGRLTKRALRPVNRDGDSPPPAAGDAGDQDQSEDNKPEEIIQLLENIASKFNQPSDPPSNLAGAEPETVETAAKTASQVQSALLQEPQQLPVPLTAPVVAPPVRTPSGGVEETKQSHPVLTTQPSYAVEDVSLEELAELDEIEKFAYTQAAVHSQQPQPLSAGCESQRSNSFMTSQRERLPPLPPAFTAAPAAAAPPASTTIRRSHSAVPIARSQSELGRKAPLSRLQAPLQCYRFVALEVGEGAGMRCKSVLCTLVDSNVPEGPGAQSSSRTWTIKLCDEWYFTPVSTGDTFHVVGLGKQDGSGLFTHITLQQPNVERELCISNARGLLVLHPDILISPTKVADACNCDRKGALSERLKTFGNLSRPATLGNVKHTFAERIIRSFNESVLRAPQRRPAPPNQQAINAFVQESRATHVAELYAVDANDVQIDAELRGMVGPLWQWLTGTLGQASGVRRSQTVPARNRPPAPSSTLQLDHVVGTEENIWSPVFGLKGQIDVTAVTKAAAAMNEPHESGLSPLELKTGKRRDYVLIPHKAQVMLYLLLLQTRVQHTQYARVGKEGFLVYLSNDGVVCENVLPIWDELRSLMIARNRCALSARGPSSGPLRYDSPLGLPSVIRQPNDCQRCYQAAECMLYHAASENGTAQSSGVPELFQQIVQALSPEHLSYFRHWDRLIELESTTGASSRPELWTLDGIQREQGSGKCIGSLVCEGVGQDLVTGDALLTFTRHTELRESAQLPLKELPFAPGDRVIVSLDGHRSAARDSDGLVDLEDCRVTAVGHPLGYGVHLFVANVSCIDDHSLQLRATDLPEHLPRWIVSQGGRGPKVRVDKDELSTGIATMRSNLAQMLIEPYQPPRSGPAAENAAQAAEPTDVRQASAVKLRSLVVELRAPRFNHLEAAVAQWFANPPAEVPCRMGPNGEQYRLGYPTMYPGCAPQQLVQELQTLNPDQRAAIHKALSAEDYALLLGMPGTGKTSTIACLVRTLVARGATVLLSSYTHSAVDNMLQKLVDSGVTPGMALRIGSKHQTPPNLHPYLLESQGVDTIARLAEAVESSRIVAVTCLGIRHPIFSKKRFDVCILDEAGQAPQPAALGPLLSADRFVLVGDHYQLPPLVANPEAQAHGMDISLFRRLCEAHPSAVQYLSFQYRMNAEIMQLSNTLVYGQQLRCANAAVAKGRLQLAHFPLLVQRCGASASLSQPVPAQAWLVRVLDPANPVVFVDTDTISLSQRARVSGTQELTPDSQHAVETRVTELCVRALLACGCQPPDIGVITPFRNQQRAFRRSISERYGVEVSTIDKFQGRDVKALVVAFGSTSKGCVGDLLRDWRRINVAITRARFKLIMLGSRTTTQTSPVMAELLETVYSRGWNADMPEQLAREEAIVTQVLNATTRS